MPCCIVKGCMTNWRRKDVKITQHSFPWDPKRIKLWLLKTGQFDDEIDEMVQKILDGKVNDAYRMCSKHFDHDCYTYDEDRRRLRKDAVPTIFEPYKPKEPVSVWPTPITIIPSSAMQHITPVGTTTATFGITSSAMQHITPVGTTTATFGITSSGSHTFTTSALSLSSSITPEQSEESKQHSMESSSDLLPSVSPNTLIPQPTLPSVEIFPSPQPTSQVKTKLAPKTRDFSTNTIPYMYFSNKNFQKGQHKRKGKKLISSDGKRSRAAVGKAEVVPQMSSELMEQENLSSYLDPFENSTENLFANGSKGTTLTSKWSQKRSMLYGPWSVIPNEFMEAQNSSSPCIKQEDTDSFPCDVYPQATEDVHLDPSDIDEPISPMEFHGQSEPNMVTCFVKGCTLKSRQGRGDITLHVFPKDKDQIREWLTATGEAISIIEELVNQIYDSKKDLYRMCSLHFAPTCYIFNPKTGEKRLGNMAVPTIFPRNLKTGECSSFGKRGRVIIPTGSICHTCNQIVGPNQDVTSESRQRKEIAEKYVQTDMRTFSVKLQCKKNRTLKKTTSSKTSLNNIFVFGPNVQGTSSGPPVQGTSSGPPVQGTSSGPPVQGTSTETSSAQKETELSHIPQEPLRTIPIASTPNKTISSTQTTDPEEVHREVSKAELIPEIDKRGIPCIDSVASINIKEEPPSWISIDSTQPNDDARAESHPLRRRAKSSVDSIDDQLGDLEDSLSRMPVCVVKGCSPADRNSETLRVFPRDKERIRTWLVATGQYSDNLEKTVNKIFEATKKSDSYRMCEKHFAPYCFIYNAKTGKKILTKNAVPTIFPQQNATPFPSAAKRKLDEMSGLTQDSESSSTDESGESEDSEEDDDDGVEVIFSEINLCDATPSSIHPVQQRKFIVFENSLDELILKIPCQFRRCTRPITKIMKKRMGSFISIFVECADRHFNLLWKSQPTVDCKPLGNVILASALFASGNSFRKMNQFFHLANIMAISENSYSKYQHEYIFPTIEHSWKSSQMECIGNVQETPVCIAGDGRWDNNKYCVYSMMDMESKKILSIDVQQSAMGVSYPGSEKLACKNALDLQNEIGVKLLCTDHHFAIRKMIKKDYSTITHEFNVWQLAKSVGDKLLNASHEENFEDLAEWVGAIQNHLQWCSDTYNEDDALLIAKWNSFLYHVQNVHAWEDKDSKYASCQHEPLPEDTKLKRKWLKTNSPSFKALEKIVLDERLQKNIKRICHFCHNGDIEVFHNTMVKYQSDQKEQQHFTMDEMYARTQLAALDYNSNCQRIEAMVREPSRTSAESDRFNTVNSKDRKEQSFQAMYEPTNQDFLIDLIQEVVELLSGNRTFEWNSRTSLAPEDTVQDVKPDVKSIGLAQ